MRPILPSFSDLVAQNNGASSSNYRAADIEMTGTKARDATELAPAEARDELVSAENQHAQNLTTYRAAESAQRTTKNTRNESRFSKNRFVNRLQNPDLGATVDHALSLRPLSLQRSELTALAITGARIAIKAAEGTGVWCITEAATKNMSGAYPLIGIGIGLAIIPLGFQILKNLEDRLGAHFTIAVDRLAPAPAPGPALPPRVRSTRVLPSLRPAPPAQNGLSHGDGELIREGLRQKLDRATALGAVGINLILGNFLQLHHSGGSVGMKAATLGSTIGLALASIGATYVFGNRLSDKIKDLKGNEVIPAQNGQPRKNYSLGSHDRDQADKSLERLDATLDGHSTVRLAAPILIGILAGGAGGVLGFTLGPRGDETHDFLTSRAAPAAINFAFVARALADFAQIQVGRIGLRRTKARIEGALDEYSRAADQAEVTRLDAELAVLTPQLGTQETATHEAWEALKESREALQKIKGQRANELSGVMQEGSSSARAQQPQAEAVVITVTDQQGLQDLLLRQRQELLQQQRQELQQQLLQPDLA